MNKDKYPWRQTNRFTLLKDGEQFFPIIFEHIAKAQEYILIEMYLIRSGRVTDALIEALRKPAQNGVSICLLFDAYGARGLNKTDRARLNTLGARMCFFNRFRLRNPLRYIPRDHRKIINIDGEITFVGGLGFHDSFLNDHHHTQWRETVIKIEGESCQDWVDAFCLAWKQCTQRTLYFAVPTHNVEHLSQAGHVAISPHQHEREIRRNIINQLRNARQRIWISTAYFVPSRKIRRLLRRAARRGIEVKLILPGSSIDHPGVRYAGHRFYSRLLHNKVKIYEYQPRFVHQKIILIDDWVSMGSANLDRWNLYWNLEANQEVRDNTFAQQVQNMLEQDLANCEELIYEQWRQRTRWRRLQEWFWGQIDKLLLKLSAM